MSLLHKDLTDKILKTFFDVYNQLGFGFLEKVYQNAMYCELKSRGFEVEAQKKISVYYKKIEVGEYFADLIVNDLVIIELKAAEAIVSANEAQLLNYLRGTRMEVGLLLNFGVRPDFRRKVFMNKNKRQTKS
ncbi:MAG: GxxExxY protein [Candidatus Cyclonatronum sp.]|uniref:GxxExxY protein n=1 Tax=Cyclonatronum sp. TaxID=3024185 RepID=UPI0025C71361|nr:GxxExxY protein [Cyclonatronum sp.]MCH8487113.1 GxxExxY protein [Cyclonatronum sp.]